MELLIASQNPNKIIEVERLLPQWKIKGLSPELFPNELIEEGDSLQANAIQKMRQVFEKSQVNCFADDTGLEVDALLGAPGVHSARFAGESKDSLANMKLLLEQLKDKENRGAQFRTVIALHWNGKEHLFEGICRGSISPESMGDQGFGYDPIFIPEGQELSFAQMDMDAKNAISHRGRAIAKLAAFLKNQH